MKLRPQVDEGLGFMNRLCQANPFPTFGRNDRRLIWIGESRPGS